MFKIRQCSTLHHFVVVKELAGLEIGSGTFIVSVSKSIMSADKVFFMTAGAFLETTTHLRFKKFFFALNALSFSEEGRSI